MIGLLMERKIYMEKWIIWGTGYNSNLFYYWISGMDILKNCEILCFVDNDKKKQGLFNGKEVIDPSDIQKYDYDYIGIWSTKYEKEIRDQITKGLNIPDNKIKDIFSPYKQLLYSKYSTLNDSEMSHVLERMMEQQGLSVYYYDEGNKDNELKEAHYDIGAGLYYILFEGKRMYIKRSYGNFKEINGKKYTGSMWGEQDINSPHRYEEGSVIVEQDDVLVDAGACEGNFTLHNIDKIKKAYVVECDKEWMEALDYTFRPYRNKIQFCDKFLSDHDSDQTIRIDTLVTGKVNFIKMDIEGEEVNALKGARRVLSESNCLKCAICSYHRHNDEQNIRKLLQKYDLETEVSKGYMLFVSDSYVQKNPEFRRGIVRGKKYKVR